jgi:hypothetical protein
LTLALCASALVAVALVGDLVLPAVVERVRRIQARRRRVPDLPFEDPGRELRAEHKARELLRSCVSEEEWAMYRELGFIRVWGSHHGHDTTPGGGAEYAYLIYPHRPIVSYVPATGRLLHEYCVTFPDQSRPYGSSKLPDSDDVLAKWMALTGDEGRLLGSANMHLVGHQIDARLLERDVWRLGLWERARMRGRSTGGHGAQSPAGRTQPGT